VDNTSSYWNAFWLWSYNVRNEQVIIVHVMLKKAAERQPFFVKEWCLAKLASFFYKKIVVFLKAHFLMIEV